MQSLEDIGKKRCNIGSEMVSRCNGYKYVHTSRSVWDKLSYIINGSFDDNVQLRYY